MSGSTTVDRLRILLIEDNPADADLLREYIGADGIGQNFDLSHCERLDDALQQLRAQPFDIILTDFNLPDASGLPVLEELRKQVPDTPIVVITGTSQDLGLALEALRHGAQDYLIKGDAATSIQRSLRYAIERKQMEDALSHANFELDRSRRQQLELKDQVLSHVSHELRTPLTAACQFVTILKRGLVGDLQPQQKEYVDDIERNLNQLRKMIADLLETSRAESGKLTIDLQPLALQETVADVVRTLRTSADEKGVSLRADVPENVPPVRADPARIRQVLTNLVDNAQKFTPAGGSITIRAAIVDADVVGVSVTDTGRGIAPAEQQRIFSRLGQVEDASEESRKGLGLGLFICREIVRRHGGEITVESTLGAGSTFSFTLPTNTSHAPDRQDEIHG